jgi:hypothetical protein
MKFFFQIAQAIYYLLPSFLRAQYADSRRLYWEHLTTIRHKINALKFIQMTLVKDIEQLGCKFDILYQNTDNPATVIKPSKLRVKSVSVLKDKLYINAPDQIVYQAHAVNVIADTNALFINNKLLSRELTLTQKYHLPKRPEIFSIDIGKTYTCNLYLDKKKKSDPSVIYISLLCEASYNYWHWTMEILTKLNTISEVLKNDFLTKSNKYIFLVDERAPKQLIDSIEYILQFKVDIFLLAPGERFFCDKLIYSPSQSYTLDNAINTPVPDKDFFVNYNATLNLRNKVLGRMPQKNKGRFPKKIYLYRKLHSIYRPIANLNKLNQLMLKLNYDFIDPVTLSYSEQIQIFSNADIVVGMVGAGFTNILYMPEESNVILFAPGTSGASFHIFQHLADVANVNLTYYMTDPVYPDSIHSESVVNLKYLEELMGEYE